MDAAEIIEALGGKHIIARAFGVTRTAPYNWVHDGIPAHLWPDFVELARKRGIKNVTFDVLRATSRRGTNRERAVTASADNTHARKSDKKIRTACNRVAAE